MKKFLIGFDSDGCVFDVMDLKHQEAFCPAFIEHFGLQAVSRVARECWEFVNLRSRTRGMNRFPAIPATLDLMATHARLGGFPLPPCTALRAWIAAEKKHGGEALAAAVGSNHELQSVLWWHLDVNARIERLAHGIPPIAGAREAMEEAFAFADLVVISQASRASLEREWSEAGLSKFVGPIAGQETGQKDAQLREAISAVHAETLMVGDAPGDLAAARSVGARFFPIIPGREVESWGRLRGDVLPAFLRGGYDAALEDRVIGEFHDALPVLPPWLADPTVPLSPAESCHNAEN